MSTEISPKWWPLTGRSGDQGGDLKEELFAGALHAAGIEAYLHELLPAISTEFAAAWVGVLQRSPSWSTIAQYGRLAGIDLPHRRSVEAMDRDAVCLESHPNGWKLLICPLPADAMASTVLVFASRALVEESVNPAIKTSRRLAQGIRVVTEQSRARKRIELLRATLQIACNLSTVHETEPLLEEIAQAGTKLLDCERTSIFIWDREHREVVACPALGVAGGSLRLPDRAGIVGDVLANGDVIRIDDAYADPRFNKKVDADNNYKTKTLLCGPLLDPEGKIMGAFEAINKRQGIFSAEDETTLHDLGLQIAVALRNAREREVLVRSHQQLTEQVSKGVAIIGESSAIVAMRSTIRRLAATDLPVLILGESGTGKEVVASSLHYQGPRAERPFVAVNCAALAETLLESELFGHEKGAFTDAHEARRGKFELAEGGTIFLDEIGDMSLGGQAKLLRVLEQKVITRVGGSQTIPINARVIAATNANLADAVRARKFREDLYFRLNVVTLDLPPLRDRAEDVIPLAEHFLKQFAAQARRPRMSLSADARRRLQAHGWPGNVRELRNLMERVAFLAPAEKVEVEDLAFILSPDRGGFQEPSLDMGLSEATNSFQQDYIRRAIKRVRGNMSEAARLLGLHRSNLYRKMRQLEMSEAGNEDEFV